RHCVRAPERHARCYWSRVQGEGSDGFHGWGAAGSGERATKAQERGGSTSPAPFICGLSVTVIVLLSLDGAVARKLLLGLAPVKSRSKARSAERLSTTAVMPSPDFEACA